MSEDWAGIAAKLGYTNESQMWTDLYTIKEWSSGRIADMLGFSCATVRNKLREHKIKLRSRGGVHRYTRSYLRLLRMDTRQAIHGSLGEASRLASLSVTTVWKFRRWAQEGGTHREDSFDLSNLGAGEVVSTGKDTSSASADR